jgi:hypothetical protein
MEEESDEMEDAIMLCEAAAELGPMIAVVVNVVNGERRCLERLGLACVCPFCEKKQF